jgi:UDP-N-acetyl-D-mannosaminuronic acid dehydrogenase
MTGDYDVCIIGGAGHIGLPLGIAFADAGKRVVLYDINEKALGIVAGRKLPFLENNAEEALGRVLGESLFLSTDREVISRSQYVVIVLGTPVDEHLNPEFNLFRKFFDDIISLLEDDQHIILRSTVYPGTTEKIKRYFEACNKRTRISFCPERIAQGYALEELRSLPQIISSFDDESARDAAKLFLSLTNDIMYLSPVEAELAKLFTNVWRYVLFAISNQFYQIASRNEVDFYRIYEAITYKYPRVKGFPTAGFAAGPCLFKDTMQLAAFSDNNFFLGHAAMLINEGLPNFIAQRLKDKYKISDKTVGILGMAFKANNDDSRESLSYKLKKIVEIEAKAVLCSDVYIKEPGFVSERELIERSDIIILGATHKEYAGLEFGEDKIVVDIWNFYGNGGLF